MAINFNALATGALAFTLALTWNEAVSKTIKSFFPSSSIQAELINALIITLLIILIVVVINSTKQIVHLKNGHNIMPSSPTPTPKPIVQLWEPMIAHR